MKNWRTPYFISGATDQRPRAANAIGDEAEKHAPDAGCEQCQRVQQSRLGLGNPEVAHDVSDDHRVQHYVEGIEHPAERSREHGSALDRRGGAEESRSRYTGHWRRFYQWHDRVHEFG